MAQNSKSSGKSQPPPSGEEIQQQGIDGSEDAKRWLESTCRARAVWNNPGPEVGKLKFRKGGALSDSTKRSDWFSLDLGGFLEGELEGKIFYAESKYYQNASDQPTHYRMFLARCYRVLRVNPQADCFIWITWAPFLVTEWDKLRDATFIRKSIESSSALTYTALTAGEDIDPDTLSDLAERLVVVVLSQRQQEILALQGKELRHVKHALMELRSSV